VSTKTSCSAKFTLTVSRQRAYRQRRDKRVEELETRNAYLERYSSALLVENQQLKRHLREAQETQSTPPTLEDFIEPSSITLAPSTSSPSTIIPTLATIPPDVSPQLILPSKKTSKNQKSNDTESTELSHRNLLDARMTWNLIQSHWLYKHGYVRIEDVYQKLWIVSDGDKTQTLHDKAAVIRAIESCATGKHHDSL
jgi:AP-1-like factor